MRLLEALKSSTSYLSARGVDSARLEAEWIFAHQLGVKRLQLYLQFERLLTDPEMAGLREAIRRRGTREPLQHILGTAEFCGLAFEVTRDVLIPRPETELLAERAWTWLAERARAGGKPERILDWGTGSGCLAVTLAQRRPEAVVTALDVSPAALEIAGRNAARHGVATRVRWQLSDGCQALPSGEQFDLVIANPPYIPRADLAGLAPEVKDHDPRLALDGGEDGLDPYRRMATDELPGRLAVGGRWMAEFGDGQAGALRGILEGAGWRVLEIGRDDTGRERYFIAEHPGG